MSLPEDFSPWEHLQDVLRRTYNQEVREEFRDIVDEDSFATPRSSLKLASLLRDDDSAIQTLIRMLFFYVTVRRAQDIQTPIFGVPVDHYQANVKFRPIVKLYFKQDLDSVPEGRRAVEAIISYRIRNEEFNTITEGELRQHANRIKSEFGLGSRYVWSKGKVLVTYKDLDQGLNFQIYAISQSEAIAVMRKIADCAQVTFDNDLVVTHESERTFPNNPGSQVVLGKTREKPVERPTVNVRFMRATASIWGLPNDVILVADRFSAKNTLVDLLA